MGNFINKQSNIGNNTHIFNKVYTTKLNDGENEVSIADLTSDSTKPTDINDYIVESYRDGTEWYEVYKSGKVRQGGIISDASTKSPTVITFLKPFKNIYYNVLATIINGASYGANPIAWNITTTSMSLSLTAASHVTGRQVSWQVEGQGE